MRRSHLLTVVLALGWAWMVSGQGGSGVSLECMRKLLPCQPFIGSTATPSPMCCLPLMKIRNEETGCLCGFFFDDQLMKSFNISKVDALKLASTCGVNADITLCMSAMNGTSSLGSGSLGGTAAKQESNGSDEKNVSWKTEALISTVLGVLVCLGF
ncbi:non-specific lipid transfer protein GPI-anchored 9-like [Wolffia australiana]